MKVGIVGTGNMGSILVEAFIESKAVREEGIYIFNRTLSKAANLQEKFPQIHVCTCIEDIVKSCELLFVCVKPGEMYPLFQKIAEIITPVQCVVSITSPISVEQMESVLPCNTVRFIPSITNKVLSGVSLLTFGNTCSEQWKLSIHQIASLISEGIEIDNRFTRVSSDIVSCGPAFYSFLAQEFINGAIKTTNIDRQTATLLTEKMLIGFGELLKSGNYSLSTLQEKVCVKGGITGEGINVLEKELGDVFENMFKATHHKFEEEIKKIEKQFQLKY